MPAQPRSQQPVFQCPKLELSLSNKRIDENSENQRLDLDIDEGGVHAIR